MIATLNHTPESSLYPAPGVPLPLPARKRRKRRTPFHFHPSPRRGLSLIEVLMSIFVLTTGLLGIAMVIPAGNALMVEAAKSDRSGACGRAALNELQVRGWLKPGEAVGWVTKDTGGTGYQSALSIVSNTSCIRFGQSFAIDPLFLSAPANDGNPMVRPFPYRNATTVAMPRITIYDNTAGVLPFPVADRILSWGDELIFNFDSRSDSDRPRLSARWSNGEAAYFPNLPADDDTVDPSAAIPLTATSKPNVSWLATVTPVLDRNGDTPVDSNGNGRYDQMYMSLANIQRYEVSIVVFYGRDLYCPTAADYGTTTPKERSVFARLDGGGVGGGDVYLMSADRDWLDLKKNNWIMLKGLQVTHAITPDSSYEANGTYMGNSLFLVTRDVFKWYRVVGVDDVEDGVTLPDGTTNACGRYVTLAGPDWDVDTNFDGSFSTPTDYAEAAIVEDVVGVYTSIIEVNAL